MDIIKDMKAFRIGLKMENILKYKRNSNYN